MDGFKLNLSGNVRRVVVAAIIVVAGIAIFTATYLSPSASVTDMPGLPADFSNGAGAFNTKQKVTEAHWQGMEVVPLTWEIAAKLGIPLDEKGVLVDEVTLASADSGLQGNDIIKSVNGVTVTDLNEFYDVTKRLRNQQVATIVVARSGRSKTIELVAPDVLGFAQLESAPMILPGAIAPHRYRGACTDCHAVGNTGHVSPDPEMVTLMPPPISKGANCPHRYRGQCKLCHVIK